MQTAPELISVIIPTFNRADIVGHAIESALAQDYPNKQIIVVDDGSSDTTAQVVKRFSEVDYVYQNNAGAAAARNNGLSRARGAYVATLDSDDCWDKNYLTYGIDCLRRFNAGLFFANWREAEVDGSITATDYFASARRMQPYLTSENDILLPPQKSRELFLDGLPAPSSGLIMQRTLVDGWESLRIGEDWLMGLKAVLRHRAVCVFTKKILWTKRRDGKNVYDLAKTTPELQCKLAVDTEKIGTRIEQFLSPAERRAFHRIIAEQYFDYAYSISGTEPMRAISFYQKSNSHSFQTRTCLAVLKALVKALRHTRPQPSATSA
jgi:hypothetical protein